MKSISEGTELWWGHGANVPKSVAICPECGSQLVAESHEWEEETGRPTAVGIYVNCLAEEEVFLASMSELPGKREEMIRNIAHRYAQSEWQTVKDRVVEWCGARREF